jgi:hypothetical protein
MSRENATTNTRLIFVVSFFLALYRDMGREWILFLTLRPWIRYKEVVALTTAPILINLCLSILLVSVKPLVAGLEAPFGPAFWSHRMGCSVGGMQPGEPCLKPCLTAAPALSKPVGYYCMALPSPAPEFRFLTLLVLFIPVPVRTLCVDEEPGQG